MSLHAVLLDVDGTLIDSNDAHARAWVEALAELGRDVAFTRVRALIGMGGDKLLPAVTGIAADSTLGEAVAARRQNIFLKRHLPSLHPFPGARALLERLRSDGVRLIVASSAQPEELEPVLQRAGVADLTEARASSGDAAHSKPDPDIVHAALQRAAVHPADALMIGDTPYDVEAARTACVDIIALRCGGWHDRALSGAMAVYDDPADLLAHYDRSPLRRRRSEDAAAWVASLEEHNDAHSR